MTKLRASSIIAVCSSPMLRAGLHLVAAGVDDSGRRQVAQLRLQRRGEAPLLLADAVGRFEGEHRRRLTVGEGLEVGRLLHRQADESATVDVDVVDTGDGDVGASGRVDDNQVIADGQVVTLRGGAVDHDLVRAGGRLAVGDAPRGADDFVLRVPGHDEGGGTAGLEGLEVGGVGGVGGAVATVGTVAGTGTLGRRRDDDLGLAGVVQRADLRILGQFVRRVPAATATWGCPRSPRHRCLWWWTR